MKPINQYRKKEEELEAWVKFMDTPDYWKNIPEEDIGPTAASSKRWRLTDELNMLWDSLSKADKESLI